MTNDANDQNPRRDGGSPGGDASASTPSTNDNRTWWVNSPDASAESSASENPAPSEPNTPEGRPTPGHKQPVGRREAETPLVSRSESGTSPKPLNERPTAPEGHGAVPTTPRAVAQGQSGEVPDMVWAAPRSATPRPEDPADTAERPVNPFAPKPQPKKSRLPLRRSNPEPAAPTGKRVAEPVAKPSRAALRKPLGRKNVAALTIAGISALCVIAVIAAYALWAVNRDSEVAGQPGPELSATPGPVLGGPQMLSEAMAKQIDPARTWQQNLDSDGINDASPQVACVGPQVADQPNPLITHLRGVSASGDDRSAALHRADAYATAEDATKVFDFRSAELGACTDTSLYVEKGMDITGIGDQAVGVRLVLQDTKPEYHTMVLVRTGRVVNVLDVARTGEPADMEAAVKALSQSINRQCGPAVGLCTAPVTTVAVGVPPAGGEQPGLLTAGDIPRVTLGQGTWRGNAPAKRIDIQDGSSCEAIDFATVGGTSVDRTQRTYQLRNDPAAPPQFGIDQVVLKLGSAQEATDLVNKTSENIASCATRTLTSKVDKQAPLRTPGQKGVEVKGNWYIITQKVDQTQTQKYRVGIFSAGDRVIYLRSNPTDSFDFTDDAWIGVNLRAGERITQVM